MVTERGAEQQVSPDSTSPSSQTLSGLPGNDQQDDISIDSYRGYPSPGAYAGSSPQHSPGPDTTETHEDDADGDDSRENNTSEVNPYQTINFLVKFFCI